MEVSAPETRDPRPAENSQLGLAILAVAALVGIFGDALLRAVPFGVNASLWLLVIVAGLLLLVRWKRIRLAGEGRWMLIPIVVFAFLYSWRDAGGLQLAAFVGLVAAFSLLAARGRIGSLRGVGLASYAVGAFVAGLGALAGALPIAFADIDWTKVGSFQMLRRGLAVARGLVLALPVLFVFGVLLASADVVFATLVRETFELFFDNWLSHFIVAFFCAWIVCGFLRTTLLAKIPQIPMLEAPTAPKPLTLGIVEIGLVVGLLDLLFASFVAVQLRYFFGGAALVVASPGLTYAEYSRRGFFELVTVAALVLPLLLLAHWLLRENEDSPGRSQRIYRALAGLQLALLFVIMASAAERMRIYQREYGLTELRFYASAFMVWLAVLFLWFAATVLAGKRERFAFGALIAGFLWIGALYAVNPDATIVRVNTARLRDGRTFDAKYAISLSADAVPAILAAMPYLPPEDRAAVEAALRTRWNPDKPHDWRTFTLSSWRALNAVAGSRAPQATIRGRSPVFD